MDKFQTGTLRAYEVLKAFGGGSANRLKALLAFIEPELAQRDGQRLDIGEFIASINQNMKLSVTEDAFMAIVPAIEREGWLVRVDAGLGPDAYIVKCHRPPVPTSRSTDVLADIGEQFAAFLNSREVDHKAFPRDREYLAECLTEWLISIDTSNEYSIASAAARFHNSPDQIEFFCARFVNELIERQSEVVKDLQLISDVGLLSDMVKEFKKPLNELKSTDLRIILDSPILLELLGTSGDSTRRAAEELVNRLSAKGARFHFVETSIVELRRSIQAMLDLPIYERYGPTHASMQRGEIDQPFVLSVYHKCRELLRDLGVIPLTGNLKTKSADRHFVTTKHVEQLTRDLENVYRSQAVSHQRARHDAEAVATVMRLRAGEFASSDLFEARYIFLTRNDAFRNTARAFCLRDFPENGALMTAEEVGPVVDIKEMASAIFARMPSDEREEFSRLSLMAGCERVLRLNRKVVAKVSIVVNKLALSGSENAEAMRKVRIAMLHPGSSLYIQDRLRGENRTLTYEEVLAEHRRYEQDNVDKGIEKNRSHYRNDIRRIEEALEGTKAEVAAKGEELKAKQDELDRKDAELDEARRENQRRDEEIAERSAESRRQEIRRGERIIANVRRGHQKLRFIIGLGTIAIICVLIILKLLVEKKWSAYLEGNIFGLSVPLWIFITLALAVLIVGLESAGGIFGESKIPFVRNWLAKKLREYMESDQEYDAFTENSCGLAIWQSGFDFEIVEQDNESV